MLLAGADDHIPEAVYLYDMAPPVITGLERTPPGDVLIDTFFTLSAVASDAATGGGSVLGAEYRLDEGTAVQIASPQLPQSA